MLVMKPQFLHAVVIFQALPEVPVFRAHLAELVLLVFRVLWVLLDHQVLKVQRE